MYAQGTMPFSEAPNALAPRVVFDILATRPGLELKNAKCPVLLVISEDDDMIPRWLTESIVKAAHGSQYSDLLWLRRLSLTRR
jgi:pimeloyl-ACP methyl ester carboxylesterase